MSEPQMAGREHWLLAEHYMAEIKSCTCGDDLAHGAALQAAQVHALLALAAPAYGFHQEARPVVADSPNIVRGKDEGLLVTFTYGTPPERVQGECNVPECDQHG